MAKFLPARNSTKKKLTVKSQRTYISTKKSKQQKYLAQKICGEMSQSKNNQAGKSYGNGCEIKKLMEKLTLRRQTATI